jgi:hypothetical protein
MRHRLRWVSAACVTAALVAVIAVRLGPLLVPAPRVLAVAEPDCDLRAGPCIARFAGGGGLDRNPGQRHASSGLPALTVSGQDGLTTHPANPSGRNLDQGRGGEVTLDVEPRGIPVIRPLVLRVEIRGLEVSAVAVDFAGVDMQMGYNRPALAPVGSGSWRGTGMLPTCVRARMLWEAKVLLTTPAGLFAAPFRFETIR